MSAGPARATSGVSPAPTVIATYGIEKLGHTGSHKKRLLCIRSDVLVFLDGSRSGPNNYYREAPIKRIIAIPCVHAVASFEGGKQAHLLIRNEHDVFFWKEDNSPVDDIVSLILRLTRQSGNPVNHTRELGSVDPDEMRLEKFPGYNSIARKCELRRAKSRAVVPPGPISLQSWDLICSSLPFAIDASKMSVALQNTFQGMHIVMLGSVLVHPTASALVAGGSNGTPTLRVLAFTPTRFLVCDEDTGKEVVSCCIFSLSGIALNADTKSVTLNLCDEPISSLTFSFPPTSKSSGAHVSDDVGVIANVIRFLLAREGVDVVVTRDGLGGSGPSSPLNVSGSDTTLTLTGATAPAASSGAVKTLPPSTSSAPLASPTTGTSSPTTNTQPSARPGPVESVPVVTTPLSPKKQPPTTATDFGITTAQVPDFRNPWGPIAQKFKTPHVLLARQVLRLTSKGAWEPRVVVITAQKRLIVCDEKTNVKRSVHLDQVEDLCTISHWEGQALAIKIHGEHDLVVKLHPDLPAAEHNIAQMVLVLQTQVSPSVVPWKENTETKERLRDILLRERPMKKGTSFVTPAQEMSRRKASLAPSSHADTQPPSPADSPSPSRAQSRVGDGMQSSAPSMSLPPSQSSFIGSSPPAPEVSNDVSSPLSAAMKTVWNERREKLTDDETNARELIEYEESKDFVSLKQLSLLYHRNVTEAVAARRLYDQQQKQLVLASAASDAQREAEARQQQQQDSLRIAQAAASLMRSEERFRERLEEDEQEAHDRNRRDELNERRLLHAMIQSLKRLEEVQQRQQQTSQPEGGKTGQQDPSAPTAPPSPLPTEVSAIAQASPTTNRSLVQQHQSSLTPPPRQVNTPSTADYVRDDNSASTVILYRKEVQLFPPAQSLSRDSVVSATPNGSKTTFSSSGVGINSHTPQSSKALSRMIVFPTPGAESMPVRGADGSKNCFFRIKIGSGDSIAVVGSEKFAALLQERFKGPSSDVSTTLPQQSFVRSQRSVNPSPEQRVICVSTDEPRVACGDLDTLLDVLRVSSMRSWIRRDVVMLRSTSFLWVEMGAIPFVVAIERGERPAQIGDRLLAGGTSSSSSPRK